MTLTRSEWFMGVATTVLVIIAGTFSFDYVNRRYQATAADPSADTSVAPAKPTAACVDGDGAWKNWSYPNVPMLSPKCE
jgi:hypothetical protein